MRDMYMELQKLYSSVKLCVTVHTKSYVMFGHNSTVKCHLSGRHLSEHVGYPTVGSTKYF